MYITVVIGGILLIAALVGVAMWCCYRAGWDNGYDQASGDQKEATQAERVRGRHARTQPRTTLVKPRAVLPIPGPGKPQAARTSEPGTAILPKHGSITYALDAAGVRPRIGPFNTTGEQRAITDDYATWLELDTDEYNAQKAAEDEIFRLGLALD